MFDAGEVGLDAALRTQLGAGGLSLDPSTRRLVSTDIGARAGAISTRVVSPADTSELSVTLALLHKAGTTVAVRGGGASYSDGYQPQGEGVATLDLRRMDRVLAIDPLGMTATVQAGCTWSTLHDALKPLGLRTPYWGTLSGAVATVGGSIAQEAVLFGSARHGSSGSCVLALAVVLADGSVLNTGGPAGAEGGPTFFRGYGPDLTGVFCGDCGAFGVKAEITLRLVRIPGCATHLSFAFAGVSGCSEALAELARAELAAEAFAFDPTLSQARLRRVAARTAIRSLAEGASSGPSRWRGVGEAARLGMAGRPKVGAGEYSLHLSCEGRSPAAVEEDCKQVRAIVSTRGGREIENTLPTVLRAKPFRPLNGVLGPAGERWRPVHGLVSVRDASAACKAVESALAARAADFQRLGIEAGLMLSVISTHTFLIEAVFTWPDRREAIHEHLVEPQVLARLPVLPANPQAREAVNEARQAVIEALGRFGAAHLQIGRTYPYRTNRDGGALALLDTVKSALDPDNRLNPSVLGFAA